MNIMEWMLVLAGVVLVVLGALGRYAVRQMRKAWADYQAALAREELREIKAFLETQRRQHDAGSQD